MRHWSLVSVQCQFWELVAAGWSTEDAAAMVGVSATCGLEWFRKFGGVNPQFGRPRGQIRPRLSIVEREEIMVGTRSGESIRSIARRLGRAPSTVMREIYANGRCRNAPGRYRALHRFGANRGGWDAKSLYRASMAQARSETRARRPKTGKLASSAQLRREVEGVVGDEDTAPNRSLGMLAMELPRSPGDAGVARNHLSSAIRARTW